LIGACTAGQLAACGAEQTVVEAPAETPPKPWKAEPLAGPFPSVADFCKTLAAPTCEERDDTAVAIGDSKKPLPTKDGGAVQLVTVTSSDGKMRRAHLLLKRGTELFALPPAQEYDPSDGKRRAVTVRSFAEVRGLFVLSYGAEATSGDGDSIRQEMSARQALCQVAKDFPIACALFETERSVATGAGLTTVPEETAEVLVAPGDGGRVTVTAHSQSGPKALEGLAAPGEYRIAFP
jgi:hypothetical protein